MQANCVYCGKVIDCYGPQKYCSEKCRNMARQEREKIMDRGNKTCPYCKQVFYPKHRNDQVYCSEQCREKAKWERKKPIPTERICLNCGTAFIPIKGRQKYCSEKCRIEKYYADNKERIKERTTRYRLSHLEQECENKRRNRELNKERYKQRDMEYHDSTRFGGNKQLVLERDGYKCAICGATEGLVVHHKDETGQLDNPNNDPSNLISVCKACHAKIHKPTQWHEVRRQTVYCQACGKEMSVINARIAVNRGKYCSRECADKGHTKLITINCRHCGKPFGVQPARLNRGKVKYCSMECRKAAGYSSRSKK